MHENANTIVVLDFETTGLSPINGDRAIEIGAVRLENGVITERFQELMNPGFRINGFIENYTGITNSMLKNAPPCAEVMERFVNFIKNDNLLAHNASFDQRFLDAELSRLSLNYTGDFACSLLVSRRIYQDAPNHKLGTLIKYKDIECEGAFHRALFDAEMTASLWIASLKDIQQRMHSEYVPFDVVIKLMKIAKKDTYKFLDKYK
ncbi:MAG: 3'-5' exonuclease [Colwelliaceae bacterium]|jgi:DNA polymerase-3 subunit epsilon|nr:3'-5' exonuclease [Colwelliaceae bacterium]